jgi:putative oxygen-independent coproporphyrinogen III oxidase
LQSIYFGGGTPSLFTVESIARLLDGIRERIPVATDAEITLEANPGATDQARFAGYRASGVNRLSIGVQSLSHRQLQILGRIHDPAQARAAAAAARDAGFDDFNLDLMFALPEQSHQDALVDLHGVMALEPSHISLYQLTLEPNTLFYQTPPTLPDDDQAWAIQQELQSVLAAAEYKQYEVSAYARSGRRSRHNLNYWQFGDYLGIGAGAHGKLTGPQGVARRWKTKHPRRYLETAGTPASVGGHHLLGESDLVLEFAMNALRLVNGVPLHLFTQRTGLPASRLEPALARAEQRGFVENTRGLIRPTALGYRYLNFALELFMDAA